MIDFIKSQVLTEKTSKLLSQNKYTFDVDISLNKKDIAKILEDLFGVKVLSVLCTTFSEFNNEFQNFIGLLDSIVLSF